MQVKTQTIKNKKNSISKAFINIKKLQATNRKCQLGRFQTDQVTDKINGAKIRAVLELGNQV
jgi:hypothetical protein